MSANGKGPTRELLGDPHVGGEDGPETELVPPEEEVPAHQPDLLTSPRICTVEQVTYINVYVHQRRLRISTESPGHGVQP